MEFQSKYRERDLELPKHRDKLLDNALDDLMNDSDVLAIYLAGSLGKGNFDNYSDIDLHIIVIPEKKPDFVQSKRIRPKKWGEVLYYEESSPQSPVIVVHYDCFVKADIWYHGPSEVQPSLWMQGLKALYDPKCMLEEVFEMSSSLVYKPTADEVEMWRGKIFAYIHETYRSVMRNETYYALSQLNSFRWMMAYGWYMEMEKRVDSSWGVWSKFEGVRSYLKDWQLCLLDNWDCSRGHNDIMKTMNSMIPEFFRLNKSLSQLTGLNERRDWCERIINMAL
jgi:predicted nucleotidyltransferase